MEAYVNPLSHKYKNCLCVPGQICVRKCAAHGQSELSELIDGPKVPSSSGYPIQDKEPNKAYVTKGEPVLTGGSSDYYKIPVGATDLLDLIEAKNMSFGLGNIFKACYRLGEKSGTTRKYDLEKIIFFAQRELDRVS